MKIELSSPMLESILATRPGIAPGIGGHGDAHGGVGFAQAMKAAVSQIDIAGRASQRPLRAGQVVQMRFLKAGEGVRRGQAVQIVSRQQQFQVSAAGTAMHKADNDALVRVRNNATGKVFLARVVGVGVVEPAVGGGPGQAGQEG